MPETVIVLMLSGVFSVAFVKAFPFLIHHVQRSGAVKVEGPLVPLCVGAGNAGRDLGRER